MKPEPQVRTVREWLWYLFCGLCMGSADLVPGISGGTMAFIMGFYEPLIQNIKSINYKMISALFRLRFKDLPQLTAWSFLIALLLGMITALALLSRTFAFLLNDEIYRIYLFSAFLGLVLASAIFCSRKIKAGRPVHFVWFFLGAAAAFLLTNFSGGQVRISMDAPFDVAIANDYPSSKMISNYDPQSRMLLGVDEKTLSAMLAKGAVVDDSRLYDHNSGMYGTVGTYIPNARYPLIEGWLIVCGAIGISAMLLPGISGSYLLTILGVYPLVVGAIADLVGGFQSLILEVDALVILSNLFVGIVIGAALFSRAISWLFLHYHDNTIAMLVGFMLGALQVIWPFWSYRYVLDPLKLERGPRLEGIRPLFPELDSMATWAGLSIALFSFCAIIAIEVVASKRITVP